MKCQYYEFILSANVYLPKWIESILGSIYLENNDNNKAKAKKTNTIWCMKKNGTNCGIIYLCIYSKISHNKYENSKQILKINNLLDIYICQIS